MEPARDTQGLGGGGHEIEMGRHRHRRARRLATRIAAVAVVGAVASALLADVSSAAQPPVALRTAASFAVLAGEGMTNANATTITGDVGTFPNPAQTGFDTVTLVGTNHHDDAVTQQAKRDLVAAYDEAAAAGPPTSVAVELGGTTLKPGVYNGSTLEITGTLTLDTGGDPSAVFVFQSGSTLVTAANSAVAVLGGATACNVFWQVPSSATLGTDSRLVGTVLAATAITASSGATVEGRLLAQTASVTLDHNTITVATCDVPLSSTGASSSDVPSGSTGSTDTAESAGGPGTSAGPGTPGAPTPSAPGPPTTTTGGSTPPTGAGPPFADTGLDATLALAGVASIWFGLLLLNLGDRRRPVAAPQPVAASRSRIAASDSAKCQWWPSRSSASYRR